MHVHTDGSVTPCLSTTAFVVPQLDISRQYILDHNSSSTPAELVAIREAVRFVSGQAPRKWTTFSCKIRIASPQFMLKKRTILRIGFRNHTGIRSHATEWSHGHCPIGTWTLWLGRQRAR
uniref:Protein containing RNase H domain n=1 Tax=Rhipicephalus zambeziensis TaxID=60191 RepID=A0A224YYU1_9ACAR